MARRRDRRAGRPDRTSDDRPCRGRRSCRFRSDSRDRRSRRLSCAFCSTSSSPTPVSRTWRNVANNSRTMAGDRPSDGSSSSRMSGFDISARPIATICCSPPLMVRAIWAAVRAGAETAPSTCSRRAASPSRARFGLAPSSRFSFTVRSPKMPRPSGTSASPLSTISCAASAEISRPPSVTRLPGSVRAMPAMAFSSEVLPAPLAPRMSTISPRPTCSATPSSARCWP